MDLTWEEVQVQVKNTVVPPLL